MLATVHVSKKLQDVRQTVDSPIKVVDPRWQADIELSYRRRLRKGLYVVELLGMPSIEEGHNKEHEDGVSCRNWCVGFPEVDALGLFGSVEAESCLVLLDCTWTMVAFALELPNGW